MKATLLNLSHGVRVVFDSKQVAQSVGVGKALPVDLDPDTYAIIVKHMRKGDTLLIVPDSAKLPKDLRAVVDVLATVDDEDYEAVLEKFFKVVGNNGEDMRPTRVEMRATLSEVTSAFCERSADALADALQGYKPPPPQMKRAEFDEVMDIALGERVKSQDEDEDVPVRRKRKPPAKPPAKSKKTNNVRKRIRS